MTEDLKDHLFDLTQGVVAITVKLFALAQNRAIALGGDELLAKGLFDQVMADSFEMVKPMLQALRFDDAERISKYGDLCAPSIPHQLMAAQKATKQRERRQEITTITSTAAEQVENLASMLNVGKDMVELVLDELLTADPELGKNNLLLIKKVFEAITLGSTAAHQKESKAKMKRQKSFKDGDLRLLHIQATEQDDDIYNLLLRETDYIKGTEEFRAVS